MATWLPPLGVVLLAIAASFAVHSWMFARARVRAVATITENVSSFAKEGGVVYAPRFRFRLPGGQLVLVQGANASGEIVFPAGETVPVLYPKGDPQAAILAPWWLAYQGAVAFGVLGTVLFDVGWALGVMLRRRAVAAAG